LTPDEMIDIGNNPDEIYNKKFFLDKIFQDLRTKDFRVESF
jgi:hypothetical protein